VALDGTARAEVTAGGAGPGGVLRRRAAWARSWARRGPEEGRRWTVGRRKDEGEEGRKKERKKGKKRKKRKEK
jgi:hypothetical protein